MTSKAKPYNLDCACFVLDEIRNWSKQNGVWDNPAVVSYAARCASRIISLYEALSKDDRKICREQYRRAVADIKAEGGFGDGALYMRSYGKICWFIYKCYEKTLKRLFRK